MKTLHLNKEEAKELCVYHSITLYRNGMVLLVEERWNSQNLNYDDVGKYKITVINPYEEVVLPKDF